MRAAGRYLKQNALGAIAIFIALGGTGYAAVSIPQNSIGTRQLRNGAVTPRKLDGQQISGTIFAWAYVDADGKVLASHGLRGGVQRGAGGQYGLGLTNQRVPRGVCAATASIAGTRSKGPVGGTANALLGLFPRPAGVAVNTFNAAGQAAPLPFVVEVLC